MDERARRSGRAGVLVALVVAWISVAGGSAYGLAAPPVPPAIQVPAGNVAFLLGKATGTQIYRCQVVDSGHAWTLVAPAAVLKDGAGKLIIWHYAGPSWRALDGSTVTAVRIASAPAPIPNAIPWLLLDATTTVNGPTLGPTTFIQRINTTGGVAPAHGCGASTVGTSTAVPYTADYYFFKAA
ncbi:MAG TPA: DUF3455 domain-containing protein [Acidimicrobiales bacterium]